MKVLFITYHYLDQMLGGPNASKCFLHAVASLYPETTLIFPEHNDHTTSLPFMDECHSVRKIPVLDRRSKLVKLCDVYFGKLHRFGKAVKEHLKHNSYDVVFIDHSVVASSGVLEMVAASGAKIITIHHNVESKYLSDNMPSILYRFPYLHFALEAERKSILASNLNLTITEADREFFMSVFLDKADSFHVIGTFEYERAKTAVECSKEEEHKFVISGSMSAMQTETAMLEFLKYYMPLLNDACPDAEVLVTGRNPSKRLISAASAYGNMKIVPNPENIMDEVVKGNYYICPMNTGSGLKLRCMDALRVGLPVLAHKVSACGYEGVQRDGYLYSYSSVNDFREALEKLLQLHGCHRQVVQSYYSHFSFDAGRERMKEIMSHL